jgi:thiamine biosynthesis protein ThiI
VAISDRSTLRLTASGEIFLKSRVTRDRFLRTLTENVRDGLRRAGIEATVRRSGYHELAVEGSEADETAVVASRAFGVGRVERVRAVTAEDLDDLAVLVSDATRSLVAGRRFAVRVNRRGNHPWKARDAESMIGSLLLDASAGVDLDHPEVTVRVIVRDDAAWVVDRTWSGVDGLPLGTQEGALALHSGGIDSPVAAWMMMRRGCPVDFLHLMMDCAASDQALAVAHELAVQWSGGTEPRLHVVDFQPIKDALRERVDPRMRQVVLKRLMLTAAQEVAERLSIPMLITGDSLGQVSSQTAAHLVEVDRSLDIPVLRPLIGFRKEEIIARAKEIGTFDLSVRTREVCDLSDGHRVATNASQRRLEDGLQRVGPGVVKEALGSWETVEATAWWPGMPMQPAA